MFLLEKEYYNTKVKVRLNLREDNYQLLHRCIYYFIQTSAIFEYGENVETCNNFIKRLENISKIKGTKENLVLYLNTYEYDVL